MGDDEPHNVPEDGHHNVRYEICLVLNAIEVEHWNTIEGVDEVETVSDSDQLPDDQQRPDNHHPLLAGPHLVSVMLKGLILSLITKSHTYSLYLIGFKGFSLDFVFSTVRFEILSYICCA